MARVTGSFLDTSVLLAGTIEMGPASNAAQKILAAVADGRLPRPKTAWHCCLEYYAVATRLPEELRLTPGDALKLVEEEILARFEVCDLPARYHAPFLREAAREGARGGRPRSRGVRGRKCNSSASPLRSREV